MSTSSSRFLAVSSLALLALIIAACGQNPAAPSPNQAGDAPAFARPPGDGLDARDFGTPQPDYGRGLAANATGVYVTGDTEGSLDGPNKGGKDGFVRKYDGGVIWAQQFGTRSNDFVAAVAADAAGNSYVAGYTNGALGFKVGGADGFLRKFGPTGAVAWTRQFGTTNFDSAVDVALDGSGNAFVLSEDNFVGFTVRKFSPAGALLASRTIASLPGLTPRSLAVDSAGAVVVLTDWYGGVIQGQNVRLFKLTGALADVWNVPYQSNFPDFAYDVAASGTDIYFTVQHNNATFTAYGANLVKVSGAGAVLWHRQLEPTTTCNCTLPNSVSADAGGAYVAGSTGGAFPGFTNAGSHDIVAFRYDATGARLWTRQLGAGTYGTASSDYVLGVAASDAVYVTGLTYGNLLGDPMYGGTNNADAYLLQLNKATGAVLGVDQ